jgi:hypothetical protein
MPPRRLPAATSVSNCRSRLDRPAPPSAITRGALTQYDSIALSGNDFVKAQMDYLSGSAHKFLGETDKSRERFLHAVENYPVSYYSYLSLVELVDAGAPVNDLDPRYRGLLCGAI